MPKIKSIEGLRGYLALWVVASHLLAFSGLESHLPQSLGLLSQGGLAVDVFIIISGFVITLLLTRKQENYFDYLKRRFLRLFPLFFVMLLVSAAINPIFNQNLLNLQGNHLSAEFVDFFVERSRMWWANPGSYIMAALSLLHGLIPESILPHASTAFLGQGWSLSLEWQFYLVAPLLVAMLMPPTQIAKIIGGSIAILSIKQLYPNVGYGAALPNHIEYFIIGILSFFAFQAVAHSSSVLSQARSSQEDVTQAFPWLSSCLAICWVVLLMGNAEPLLPLAIWAIVLVQSMDLEQSPLNQALKFLLQNPVSLYFGQISYSLYLSHMIVLTITQAILIRLGLSQNLFQNGMALAFVTLFGSVILSHFTYHYIEMKAMTWGKRIARAKSPS